MIMTQLLRQQVCAVRVVVMQGCSDCRQAQEYMTRVQIDRGDFVATGSACVLAFVSILPVSVGHCHPRRMKAKEQNWQLQHEVGMETRSGPGVEHTIRLCEPLLAMVTVSVWHYPSPPPPKVMAAIEEQNRRLQHTTLIFLKWHQDRTNWNFELVEHTMHACRPLLVS